MCLTAVANNRWTLQFVPDKFKTLEMIDITLSKMTHIVDVYEYINWDILTEDDLDYLKLKYDINKQ
jgi:hypothetical protein